MRMVDLWVYMYSYGYGLTRVAILQRRLIMGMGGKIMDLKNDMDVRIEVYKDLED